MSGMRWAITILLALYSPVTLAAAQTRSMVIATDLTPDQRQQLIQRCNAKWQKWCSQLGIQRPRGTGNADSSPNDQTVLIRRCYSEWQPYCERLGVPNPENSDGAQQGAGDRQRAIRECRAKW